jgi:hypothetical protein
LPPTDHASSFADQPCRNASNWRDYPSMGMVISPPGALDDVYFVAGYDDDCYGIHAVYGGGGEGFGPDPPPPEPDPSEFHSVRLLLYGGTVTTATPFSTMILVMTSGTIDQPATLPGTNITVTGHDSSNDLDFKWIGGTINSTNDLSNLIITGSNTSGQIFEDGETVYLGSNLTLSDGAEVTMKEGTINVNKDEVQFEVNDNCGLIADAGENKEILVAASPGLTLGPDLQIKTGAWVEVRSGKYSNDGRAENRGGKFTLTAGTEAFFKGLEFGDAYLQSAGSTFLHAGSILSAGPDRWVTFKGGTLQTVGAGTDAATGWATIQLAGTGRLSFEGGDLYINSGPGVESFGNDYGTLRVVGDAQWIGGTFHPRVPAEHNGWDADRWYVTKHLDIRPTAGVPPNLVPVALSDENDPMVPTVGFTWKIIEADGGIGKDPFAPSYDENLWAIDPINNPVTIWNLRAK